MNRYGQTAQDRLREKLDYELWLLDFLSKTQETFEGGSDISTITLRNRERGAHMDLTATDVIGSGTAMKVMDAMMPLTFTASYKILDMIFEWILEENRTAGNVKNIPWRFVERIETISNSQLIYPPLLQTEPYIKDYSFALYKSLLKFRNEVVHRHNFSVSGNKLVVDTTVDGHSYTLVLDRSELGALVRVAIASAKLLIGDLPFGSQVDRLLKYHLNRIQKLHALPEFKQAKPLLVNVILEVPVEKEPFPADLKFVRQEVSRIHPNADIQFNLKIVGLANEKPSVNWFFPADKVPETDLLELRANSFEEYCILPSE